MLSPIRFCAAPLGLRHFFNLPSANALGSIISPPVGASGLARGESYLDYSAIRGPWLAQPRAPPPNQPKRAWESRRLCHTSQDRFRFFIDSESIFAYHGKSKYLASQGGHPRLSVRPVLTATGSTAWDGTVSSPELPAKEQFNLYPFTGNSASGRSSSLSMGPIDCQNRRNCQFKTYAVTC